MSKISVKWDQDTKQIVYQIIIIMNILWILLLGGYYAFRLVHFYKLEHKKEATSNLLVDTITLNKNIVREGDGLYEEENTYLFKGNVNNNYVYYSGLLWRILGVDENSNIRLVSDESMTTLYYGTEGYEKSHVKNWLVPTEQKDHTGVFLRNLNDTSNMLVKTTYCIDTITDVTKVSCENKKQNMVGLLSLSDYEKAKGKNSYLNNKTAYYTTSTDKDNNPWVVGSDGNVVDVKTKGSSYDVRSVITLHKDTILYSGDGTSKNPYRVENTQKNKLKDINVGEYLNYSNKRYRVIGADDNKVKVILDGTLNESYIFDRNSTSYNPDNYGSVAYYLNQSWIGTLEHPEWLKPGIFYTGAYNEDNDYNYINTYDEYTEAYFGLAQAGDYFISSYDNVYTLTPSIMEANTVISIHGGKLFADIIDTKKDIRPVLFLDNTLQLTGEGTREKPYEVNYEKEI